MKTRSKTFVGILLMGILLSLSMTQTSDISSTTAKFAENNDVQIQYLADTTVNGENNFILVGFGKEDNYIPELRLLVSTDDGATWTENIKNLVMGVPFYLRIEASVRVPGGRLQTFGAKKIESYFIIPKTNNIIDFSFEDSDSHWESFVYNGKNINNNTGKKVFKVLSSVAILGAWGWLSLIPAITDNSSGVSGELVESVVYSFDIPTSPINDKEIVMDDHGVILNIKKVKMTFRCTPKQSGKQSIFVIYEDRVSDTYRKEFTLVIN